MPQKETHKSLTNKLRRAKAAIDEGRYIAVGRHSGRHVEEDMQELGLPDTVDYWDLVYQCIQLAMVDPVSCYRKPRHPGKQTKDKGPSWGKPMIPFQVEHEDFDQPLYFKFCLVEAPEGVFTYYHIDCHGPREHHEF